MNNLVYLRNTLISKEFDEPNYFVGQLVKHLLCSGSFPYEMEAVVNTVTSCALCGRVYGHNLKIIKELCPVIISLIPAEESPDGFTFNDFC